MLLFNYSLYRAIIWLEKARKNNLYESYYAIL